MGVVVLCLSVTLVKKADWEDDLGIEVCLRVLSDAE